MNSDYSQAPSLVGGPVGIDTWSESDYKLRDYYQLTDDLGTL